MTTLTVRKLIMDALTTATEEQLRAGQAVFSNELTHWQSVTIEHVTVLPARDFYWLPHPFRQCDCIIDAECECMGGGCSDYEGQFYNYRTTLWLIAEWLEAERENIKQEV